jgi:hypothetical protein
LSTWRCKRTEGAPSQGSRITSVRMKILRLPTGFAQIA